MHFPQYPPPGLPVATPQQAKPLLKIMRMMAKPKLRRGKNNSQNIHIRRKKVKFY